MRSALLFRGIVLREDEGDWMRICLDYEVEGA